MASLQSIQSRRNAVKNIGQITKAMEVVAATKMRAAQENAFATRPYALLALTMLARLSQAANMQEVASPYTEVRPVKNTLVVVISSDKGLAGAFNANVFRAADAFLREDAHGRGEDHTYHLATVGKKARDYAAKKAHEHDTAFTGFGDFAYASETEPLAQHVLDGFAGGTWDRVVVVGMQFRTALRQEPVAISVLPASFDRIKETVAEIVPEHGRYAAEKIADEEAARAGAPIESDTRAYLYEPSAEKLVAELVPFLVRMQMHHLVLEANASEHSARRVAMKTATDNAHELGDNLTREYNKKRQEKITAELLDITGTQTALN